MAIAPAKSRIIAQPVMLIEQTGEIVARGVLPVVTEQFPEAIVFDGEVFVLGAAASEADLFAGFITYRRASVFRAGGDNILQRVVKAAS